VTTSAENWGPTSDPNPPPTGTPLKNSGGWLYSGHFGVVWKSVGGILPGTWDFSFGVEIPEPSAAGLLALGALPFLRRRLDQAKFKKEEPR
jgi:hypothetical protein